MNKLYAAALIFTLSAVTFSALAKKDPVSGTTVSYQATTPFGTIGTSPDRPVDNPTDNIFHIHITQELLEGQAAWLVYELEGVEDHTAVSRSINDQLAVGGYLVKRRRGWAQQRERINVSWLKKGDNVVRFTMPEGAEHMYQVRDLHIEIGTNDDNQETEIYFNQPSGIYFYDKAYVKGIVTGKDADKVELTLDGKTIKNRSGEFETFINAALLRESCQVQLEARHPDGSVTKHEVAFSQAENPDFMFSYDDAIWRTEKFVQKGHQENIELHGAFLSVGDSALAEQTILSITSLRTIDIPALDGGMVNVTKNHAGYRFLPHGTLFVSQVGITLPYDPALIPDGYTHEDIRTYYFDEGSHHWVALDLDTVLEVSGMVKSKTIHFTDMINGIIKVPESPEVQAYNSTSIKGIKAANPTAGINLINPPQANNTGSASISYPINIPPGRNGMQPQLAVSYNSGGGNGWIGLGWNLTIPSISIETRWGVPRYDSIYETETYVLNGEQLTPVAHRGTLQNRYADGKQFYPRVEGAFNKIIRHGDKPWNYYWEVTDKSGTRYFYGATKNGGFDPASVLRDDEENGKGNVAYWGLREIRDLNGNGVLYYYSKEKSTGLPQTTDDNRKEYGYQIYIDKITYTAYNGVDGAYEIWFTRDREEAAGGVFTPRADVSISGNLGFKMVTEDLLKKIQVRLAGDEIRSYQFKYRSGEFSKTLLESITEFDSKSAPFTTHTFNYYNEVRTGEEFHPLEDESKTWEVPDDGIEEKMAIPDGKDFSNRASLLSGNRSEDWSAGLSVSVTFGLRNVTCKTLSVGGNYSYGQSQSEGLLSLIDINGDGLSDKVFLQNGAVKYHPNLGNGVFGESSPDITGLNKLYKEKSKNNNGGFEANIGQCRSLGLAVNKGWNWSTSTTSAYFADVNGDQLIDFVDNGSVKFNKVDPETGNVEFVEKSEDTPSRIFAGAPATEVQTLTEEERQEALAQHPLHDIVKVWRAPFDGTVDVAGDVNLIQSNDPERQLAPADGVRVAIQLKDDLKWSEVIGADDYKEHTPSNVQGLVVKKGDKLFFRVGSMDNGSFDQVKWNPIITYKSDTANLVTVKDAEGNPVYRFNAQEEFVLSSQQTITAPVNGVVTIEGNIFSPPTSDNIRFVVLKTTNGSNIADTIMQRKAAWNHGVDEAFFRNDIAVQEEDQLSFRVVSSTNVDWSAIQWAPRMFYTSAPGANTDLSKSPIESFPVPVFSILPNILQPSVPLPVVFASDTTKFDTLKVLPNVYTRGIEPIPALPVIIDTITFSLKKRDTLLGKYTTRIINGALENSQPLVAVVSKDDSVYIDYHLHSTRMASDLIFSANTSGRVELDTLAVGIFSPFEHVAPFHDVIFGPLYRGWGQFAWKANEENTEAPIVQNELKLSDQLTNPESSDSFDDPDDFDNSRAYNQTKDQFIMLTALGKEQHWSGYDNLTFVSRQAMSSSRLGDDDLSAPSATQGSGAFAINKISKSKGGFFSTGVSGGGQGFSASGNYSWTNGSSEVVADYMDMNGDRYPDIVTNEKIQYTNARGGYEQQPVTHGFSDVQKSITSSKGVSASGSAILSNNEPSSINIKKTKISVGSGKNSAGLNGSYGWGDNHSRVTWMDINADGLPDRITTYESGNPTVALNLGYKFGNDEEWNFSHIQSGESNTKSAGLGVAFGNGSVNVGVGLSQSDNFTTYALQDVNGDGLPDQVSQPDKDGGAVMVRINTGNHFDGIAVPWGGANHIGENSSTSESANLSFTIGIPIPTPTGGFTIYINPSGSKGHGINREESRFMDIDGDGFPDFLRSKADGQLDVLHATIGRTNLLKEVKRPLGASFTMSYKQMGNTYDMPNNQWVLDTVKVFDGFPDDGVDNMMTSYAYEGGKYDRHEREFYGFSKVTSSTHNTGEDSNPVYTQVVQTFSNDNYYNKGLLLNEVMTDGAGNKYVEKINTYEMKNISTGALLSDLELSSDNGNAFPALVTTEQKFFEGQSDAGKITRSHYKYNLRGNVTEFTDEGDDGDEDDLVAAIAYHTNEDNHLIGSPSSIEVTGGGVVFRKREADIDLTTGNVTQIRQYLSDSEFTTHDLEYDTYGNIKKITRPENAKGERLSIEYVYDSDLNTYPLKVSNSYGYSSEATYDFRYGQVLTSTDLNGNVITYELDDVGRVRTVQGPYEKGGGKPTIEFEYSPFADVPVALTKHFDPADPNNPLLTATFVDGLGRVIQTKKDGALFVGEGKPDEEVMIVSGRVKFDAFGRTTQARYPITESVGTPEKFNDNEDGEDPTTTEYDVLNRTTKVTLPDQAVTTTEYGFDSDREGKNQFSTKTTDANGKQTQQFTDVKGRVTSVKNITSSQPVWTSFKYNAISEQIEATDDLGHTTFSQYDNLGRRIERRHPDAGTTTYRYDLAGNLTELVTANLAKDGLAILYTYDFERLTEITYPQNVENNVKYTYGEAGAEHNRAGRIVLQEDASGAQEFFYGPLGEVVKNVRTVVIPQHGDHSYITEWEYDTWNRLTSMTYADGEKVTYTYNAGGLLRSMSGRKKSSRFDYVNQLGYDKFEQRVFLEYGNGTKTTYEYEEDRRRLKTMTAATSSKRLFMDNVYGYDKVNNILSLKNNAPIPSANLMGGASEYAYEYDDLYRLKEATGSYKSSNDEHTYTLSMEYNSVGGITQKTQNHQRKGTVQKKTTYDLAYAYGTDQPHAPIHIGDQTYSYDVNGNQTGWTSDKTGQRRTILWDEENRIRSIYDNGAQHHYIYDASGERVIKGKSTGQRIFVNGEWKAGSGQMGNYTVYVNPYIVLRSGGYTKHYYIEGQRIVSKLGGGWDNNGQGPLKAGEGKVDYLGREQKVFDGIVKNLKFLGADGQILTAGKSGKVPPGQVKGSGNVAEKFRYFYHPDHLGSTSYVTDASGEVFQHLEYTAWGETFVEEHSNTDRTPYLFNGKELDEETGLYYYGARYYDPRTSVWLAVDPSSDKFPNWTPYNYVKNNPIQRIDPDGRTDYEAVVKTITQNGITTKEVSINIVYNVINLSSSDVFNKSQIPGEGASIFNTSYYDSDAKMNVSVKVNIKYNVVDNIEKVKDNQNVLFIVDDVKTLPGEQGNKIGRATLGGQVAAVEAGASINKRDGGTVLHEFGHNLGLEFADNPSDKSHSNDPSHLMYKNTGGSKMNTVDLKSVWKGWGYAGDGKYQAGSGNAKEAAKSFIQDGYKVNEAKKSAAGL